MIKTLDAVALMKALKTKSPKDKEWLEEHEGEFDDLVYETHQGQREAIAMGLMVGRSHSD